MTAEQPRLIEEEKILAPEILRAEVNLLVLPFFALSRKEMAEKDETVYEDKVERNGKSMQVLWKVSRNVNYRYPGPFDRKVHKVIEEIINELPLPIRNPIPFSIYDLCCRMGITARGGKNYREVKEALKTVVATTIESKGTFFNKGRQMWVNDIFHLYDRVVFKGEQLPNGEIADTNYLYLGTWYLESINSRYVKPLDYEYYKSLKSTIAQRLYELLGVKFYKVFQAGLSHLNYRYSTLCQLLPIAQQSYFSLAKQQLQPAHRELIQTGFLSKVQWKRFEGESDWMVFYLPGPRAGEEVEKYGVLETEPATPESEVEQLALPISRIAKKGIELTGLVEEMVSVLEDEQSRPFYTHLAKLAAEKPKLQDLIYRCLSEVKDEWQRGLIRTTKGAVFTDKIKRYCEERGIELGLKSSG